MAQVQCPNPACNSFQIRTTFRRGVFPQQSILVRFFIQKVYVRIAIALPLILGIGLVGYLLSPTVLTFIGLCLGFCLLVYFVLSIPAVKVKRYKCKNCYYKWDQFNIPQRLGDTVISYYEILLKMYAEKERWTQTGYTLAALGGWYGSYQNNWQQGIAYCEEAITLLQPYGKNQTFALALYNLGVCLTYTGQEQRAIPILQEAAALSKNAGDWYFYGIVLTNLGMSLLYQGQYESAGTCLEESFGFFRKMNFPANRIGVTIKGLAGVAIGQGQPIKAAQLAGAALALFESSEVKLSDAVSYRFQQIDTAIYNSLGSSTFEAAKREGANFPLDQLPVLYSANPIG